MPEPLTDPDDIRRYSNALRILSERRIEATTQRFIKGEIDLATWQTEMKAELRRANYEQFVVGKGGDRTQINRREYLQLGPELKRQYRYLQRFSEEIARRAEEGKSLGGITERAKLYARSTQAMMWRSAIPVKLDQVPRDGQTRCRTNCKCRLDFQYERDENGAITAVLVYWRLRPAEHCFPAGTQVLTADGERPIEDIRLGDQVMTRDGLRTVTKLYQRPFKGSLVRVSSADHTVLCTPNHPFLTQVGWIEAKDLVAGDDVVLYEDGFQQVHTEIGLPNSDDGITTRGQIGVLSLIARLLFKLPFAQGFKARMAVPPVTISLNNQVADANIHDELGLDQKVRFVTNAKFVQHGEEAEFQLGRLIALQAPMALKKLFDYIGTALGLRPQSLCGSGLTRRVVLSHVFGGLRVNQPVRRLLAEFQTKFIRLILNLLARAVDMARHFIGSHLGIIRAQKFDLVIKPNHAFRVMAGAVFGFPLSVVAATNRAFFAQDTAALPGVERIAAQNRAETLPWIMKFLSAQFAFLHRRIPPLSLYPKTAEVPVFNLEVEDVHHYVANGFVVHNCGDCIDLSRTWNPLRKEIAVSEAATLKQAVGLLLLEAHDLNEVECRTIAAMWSMDYALPNE